MFKKNVRFVIYYIEFDLLTNRPVKESDLEKGFYKYKIVVDTDTLRKRIKKIEELNEVKHIQLGKPNEVNVRVYCEFITNDSKVFSFSLEGSGEYMLVNGNKVKTSKLFYTFILDFLPKKEAETYRKVIQQIKFE